MSAKTILHHYDSTASIESDGQDTIYKATDGSVWRITPDANTPDYCNSESNDHNLQAISLSAMISGIETLIRL